MAVAGCAESGADGTTTGATTAETAPPRPLASLGLRVDLPSGFDGRIRRSDGRAVLHVANLELPPSGADDLAGEVVERLPPDGVVLALVEMGDDVLGSVLYSNEGVPEIEPVQIAPGVASGPIPEGAGGVQRFFTEAGRPFMLYVAVGSVADAEDLVAQANRVLGTLRISPR